MVNVSQAACRSVTQAEEVFWGLLPPGMQLRRDLDEARPRRSARGPVCW